MQLRTEGLGPLVVKVAGLVAGVGLYADEIRAAAAAGFRVAALDTSGDRADDPAPWPLDWDRLSGEVVAALDRLGAERAVLWGTSFGCQVCLAAATRHPGRVAGLLLCCPPEPGWRPASYRAALRWAKRRRDPAVAAALTFKAGFVALNLWEFFVPTAVSRLAALRRIGLDAATPTATILQKLELLFEDHPGLPARPPALPTTIIAGAWDLVTPLAGARRLASALGGARLCVVPCAGHALAYSRPRTYRRRAIEELTRLHAAAAASTVRPFSSAADRG